MPRLFSLSFLFILVVFGLSAQDIRKFQLHSHNDYLQDLPFWTAFSAGASSIEIDVILKDGQLMVAHEPDTIDPRRTIESLYMDPISQGLKNGIISSFDFHLLVDLKTAAHPTLEALLKIMKPYQTILYGKDNPEGLKLIISGNRPEPEAYKNYPEWMFFDYQSREMTPDLPWEKIGMVSLSFRQFSAWNGQGVMAPKEQEAVQAFIDRVHYFDKPARLWATPDSETAWKLFYTMGMDYINTDLPLEAQKYLETLSQKPSN